MLIRWRHLKEGGVHKLSLILGEEFIKGRRLKQGGRLLEYIPYVVSRCEIFK